MCKIKIKYLIASGEKGISKIEFGNNLTIIAGPSDTGKSYIYKTEGEDMSLEFYHQIYLCDLPYVLENSSAMLLWSWNIHRGYILKAELYY